MVYHFYGGLCSEWVDEGSTDINKNWSLTRYWE